MQSTKFLLLAMASVCLLAAGCASTPLQLPDEQAVVPITPVEAGDNAGAIVMWGGPVIDVTVLDGATLLEVLAYPLNRIGRPVLQADSLGRFVAVTEALLEPLDYAPGRVVTVVGRVTDPTAVILGGNRRQDLPTVDISDQHLWRPGEGVQPRLSFGVGISISN